MKNPFCVFFLIFCILNTPEKKIIAQDTSTRSNELPKYLRDRGTGMPTSFPGTYIRKNELLIYPFFEYYLDNNQEYKPGEFGYGLEEDFRGRYRASEELLLISYGITDRLAIEIEAATIQASLYKSGKDPSTMVPRLSESGLGDVQTQFDFRWLKEGMNRPELFSYFEIDYPFQKHRKLIGTPDWEFKLGTGLIKGFDFGTIKTRISLEYPVEEGKIIMGEYAIEYLKKISDRWKVYAGVEGEQDEVELITEVQWYLKQTIFLKVNNSFGLTSKATDWAPEIGVVFSFRKY